MSGSYRESYIADLEAAVKKYGMHLYHECNYRFVYDRLNSDGISYDGSGHWEHRGPITECMCGLAQILARIPK